MPGLKELAAELGIADHVYFIGRCDNVASLLFASHVGVLSSKAEGFANAILEYMAAGLPVVATDVGGVREAVVEGETGYIVPSGDDAQMAERASFKFSATISEERRWARVASRSWLRNSRARTICATRSSYTMKCWAIKLRRPNTGA